MTLFGAHHRPPADLAEVSDTHLHSWLTVLDRRLILQADEPRPEDVTAYMAVWNELKRRKGEPPTEVVLTAALTAARAAADG
jgi:hypothetical protein